MHVLDQEEAIYRHNVVCVWLQQIKQREHTEKVNLLLSCGQYKLWPRQPLLQVAELIEWLDHPPNTGFHLKFISSLPYIFDNSWYMQGIYKSVNKNWSGYVGVIILLVGWLGGLLQNCYSANHFHISDGVQENMAQFIGVKCRCT